MKTAAQVVPIPKLITNPKNTNVYKCAAKPLVAYQTLCVEHTKLCVEEKHRHNNKRTKLRVISTKKDQKIL